jgi:tetratricopeptide (TPR) repeat protein
LQMDPSFAIAHGYLGQTYLERQQYEEAVSELQTFLSLAPGDAGREAELGHAYAIAGKKEEAEQILRELESAPKNKYISNYDWAVLYSGFRDKEKTLNALEKAYEERNGRMPNVAVHPQFAFLRQEPGFQRLLLQMGLLTVLEDKAAVPEGRKK